MGTSNWQQIPFCVEALMKIAPMRVLDVGVGFGRWGIVVREFCDVWYQRVFRNDWKVRVEGIEVFPQNIDEYHRSFYNQIHVGDAAKVLPTLEGPFDVVIFGDVLEHFTKEVGEGLLRTALDKSQYVIVNIPLGEDWPQEAQYGNEHEEHLAVWAPDDFAGFGLVRMALLKDYIGRPHGSFVLSRNDPRGLRDSLFSQHQEDPAGNGLHAPDALDRIVDRVAEQAFELEFIKRSGTYKLASRLRKAPFIRFLKRTIKGEPGLINIRLLESSNPESKGREAWLLSAHGNAGDPAMPWDFIVHDEAWSERSEHNFPYGKCLVGTGGELSLVGANDPELRFMMHPWSGRIEVEMNGRSETIDLFAQDGGELRIYPARTPMVRREPRLPAEPATNGVHAPAPAAPARTRDQEHFIAEAKRNNTTTAAVFCPRWLGIKSSTTNLFDVTYPVPATAAEDPHAVDAAAIELHAQTLVESGVRHLVFSGGDENHLELVRAVRRLDGGIRCDLLWHGNYVQWSDDYVWHIFRMWVQAARDGLVTRIGTVKKGMEEVLAKLGVNAAFVMNSIPGTPASPPAITQPGNHIGVWMSGTIWKSPNPMLAALALIPDARLHAAGLGERASELADMLGIQRSFFSAGTLPIDDLFARIRQTHLTLYVTFTECCPMVPLESMSVGVPCLIGPNSHLFQDHPYLAERLVVPFPDRAEVIAQYAQRVIAEREDIMKAYAAYAPKYQAAAKASVERFLA